MHLLAGESSDSCLGTVDILVQVRPILFCIVLLYMIFIYLNLFHYFHWDKVSLLHAAAWSDLVYSFWKFTCYHIYIFDHLS